MAQIAPRTLQPPPDLPYDPSISTTLSGYLRNFSLWARHGFADKLSGSTALPGILLQASDNPQKVFLIQVNAAGTITAVSQPLGTGRP